MKIRIAGNTEGPCYFVIKSKGFSIEEILDEDSTYSDYIATKGNLIISATSMEELLGLITMQECRPNNWMMTDAEYELYAAMKYGNKTLE